MNYIWGLMLIFGIAFAAAHEELAAFSDGMMASCTKAIYFVIGLAGIMAVWSGLMNIAKESGLMDAFANLVKPLLRYLFPNEKNQETMAVMLMSFTANIFGAGNSATVFSIRTMEKLDIENGGRSSASNTMCMFMAVNMSMLQLVPITIIKIRSDAGSLDPGSIILPSIIAGIISMIVSIFVCKVYERKRI